MDKFRVYGQSRLSGSVNISGAKKRRTSNSFLRLF